MAPSVAELATQVTDTADKVAELKLNAAAKQDNGPSYPFYYPYYDPNEKFPVTQVYEHVDPGLKADPAKPHLLTPEAKLSHLSPYLGTEVTGIQLSQLSEEGLDELALYAAERKVLIFRDQDFKDLGADKQIELTKRYGRIHRHPTSGNVQGYPEFHVVYRDAEHDRLKEILPDTRINRTQWHSDVSYEKQPAGTTFFFVLDQPEVGGDTLFASQVEAYKRLSPEFQKRLEGLRAVHSAHEQAEASRRRGGLVRREPIETEHPLVRRHPVTGEKALYVNQGFTRRIVGFKIEESEYLLKFLYDHIAKGADFQIRARYQPGTVVVWDNRVTVHSASGDFDSVERRHAVRLTPQAEVPIPA
ncbi:hypothetical protein HYDPIDRAFT_112584 [Hydnomerulius pinastri MD-312]|uniref:TauD/TfdA-like domain-containing protein n=1 Tax=Hydnomerulius pinastri MD-312 TaxID=994086 RepID=A0A0C9WEM9_9AGAM|nr:hypothetical protein HYDPIDRAFT_112584 [Hydnomerulius pinastri MD-312]